MVVVISSGVNDIVSPSASCIVPCPVQCVSLMPIMSIPLLFISIATSVKCPYVPGAYLHGVFRVYQWLDQPGGVLLILAPMHH